MLKKDLTQAIYRPMAWGHNVFGWVLVRGTIRGFVTGTARGGEWALGGDLDLAAVVHSLAKDVLVVGAMRRRGA